MVEVSEVEIGFRLPTAYRPFCNVHPSKDKPNVRSPNLPHEEFVGFYNARMLRETMKKRIEGTASETRKTAVGKRGYPRGI